MSMVKRKHKGESFESMMRRFKKGCEKSDLINEKPSSVRKRTRDVAKKKEQKRQEDQRIYRT